jgi:hypothetical protein
MRKAKLMSSVEITEEPDGEQFKELLQELQARNPHENRGALEQGLRDKWRSGLTEAQIVDAVEIDLLQPDAEEFRRLTSILLHSIFSQLDGSGSNCRQRPIGGKPHNVI